MPPDTTVSDTLRLDTRYLTLKQCRAVERLDIGTLVDELSRLQRTVSELRHALSIVRDFLPPKEAS